MEKKMKTADLELREKIAALNITSFVVYHSMFDDYVMAPMKLVSLLGVEEKLRRYSKIDFANEFIYLVDHDYTDFVNAYCNVMMISTGEFAQMLLHKREEIPPLRWFNP